MEFREVTLENLKEIIALKVHPDQENLVADNLYSVAQVGLKDDGWCRAAYVDDLPVGFFAAVDEPCGTTKYVWRFMIDHAHQGKGYGKEMMMKLLEEFFSDPAIELVDLSVIRDPGSAEGFYKNCGFQATEECVGGNEWRMILPRKAYEAS